MRASPISAEKLAAFERLFSRLQALEESLTALANKEPKAPYEQLSEVKVAMIEMALHQTVQFFGDEQPLGGLESLGGDNPTISDASMILAQYQAALESFRAVHVVRRYGKSFWVVSLPAEGGEPGAEGTVEYVEVEGG